MQEVSHKTPLKDTKVDLEKQSIYRVPTPQKFQCSLSIYKYKETPIRSQGKG